MPESRVTDLRANRILTGLVPALYEKIVHTYPDAVTQVLTFMYQGNVAGVVTVTYTDATKTEVALEERTA